jgi:hypothetical protein
MKFVAFGKPIKTENVILKSIEIPDIEVPQAESIAELTQFFKGEDNLLNFANGAIRTASSNAGRAAGRVFTQEGVTAENPPADKDGFLSKLYEKVRNTTKNWTYSPDGAGTQTKAELVAALDSAKAKQNKLLAMIQDPSAALTRDQILALLSE